MADGQEYYEGDQDQNGQGFQQEAYSGGEQDTSGYAGGAGDQQLEASNTGSGHEEDDDDRKIFVGGLSWETSEQDLKSYFSKYGEITKCTLKTEAETGRSRGFGFVVFQELTGLEKVLEAGTHKLHGRNIDPKRANPKKREPNLKVFIGGLSTDTPESDIRDHFQKFGKITEIDLPVDQEKKRRGFCFIKFDTEEVVRKVTENRMQSIGGKEVEVKKSVPRRGGFQGGWGGGFGGGRGGGGRGRGGGGGRGGYGGGWNQGGYQNQGYGGYGQYNQGGYGQYNQGGYPSNYGYDYNQGYGGYNQGYGAGGNWGGYDQSYTAYDYSGWSGYGQDQGQNSVGYGKTPKRGGGHGYQPY